MSLTETQLVVSRFMQVVQKGDRAVIWHSLFGRPKIISIDTLDFLHQFEAPCTIEDVLGSIDEEDRATIEDLYANHFLIKRDFDERAHLERVMRAREPSITDGSRISFLELIMSEACNFRCTYCIHFNNLETSTRITNPEKFMKYETAVEAVDSFFGYLRRHGRRDALVNFGGGEPLLAWPVLERVLAYCTERYGAEFELTFSINTNASLVTPEIAKTLKRYAVQIATSLDGSQAGNNMVRLTKKGGPTYNKIVEGMRKLVEAGIPVDGFATTITADNFDHLSEAVIDYAAQNGMNEVRIDIDVVGMVDVPIDVIVDKLMRIRRYALSHGIDMPGFWLRAVENMSKDSLTTDVAFCGAVRGNSMCVSPNGSIYGCGYSTTKLGDLATTEALYVEGGPYHQFVRDHQTGSMDICKGCMIEAQCAGGCNITQEFARATGTAKIDRMCEFYRQMTQALLAEMI